MQVDSISSCCNKSIETVVLQIAISYGKVYSWKRIICNLFLLQEFRFMIDYEADKLIALPLSFEFKNFILEPKKVLEFFWKTERHNDLEPYVP